MYIQDHINYHSLVEISSEKEQFANDYVSAVISYPSTSAAQNPLLRIVDRALRALAGVGRRMRLTCQNTVAFTASAAHAPESPTRDPVDHFCRKIRFSIMSRKPEPHVSLSDHCEVVCSSRAKGGSVRRLAKSSV
jgi:hypothetical protein